MQPIFAINLDSLYKATYGKNPEENRYNWQAREDLKKKLTGILCTNEKNGNSIYKPDLNFNIDQRKGITVSSYNKMFHFIYPKYPNEEKQWIFRTPTDSIEVKFTEADSTFNLAFIHDGKTVETISLSALVRTLKKKESEDDMPIDEMTLTGTGTISPRIIITTMQLSPRGTYSEDIELRNFQAWILLK